jgi:hypothetical protein
MIDRDVKKLQLLQRAAELMAPEDLAQRLAIPLGVLNAWIRGESTMPDGKLLALAAAFVEVAAPQHPKSTQADRS